MKKVMVELDWDTVDGIVLSQLKETLASLEKDLELRSNDVNVSIFDLDKATDLLILNEHIEAFYRVLSFFGG